MLLHGLARSAGAMEKLELALEKSGFLVVNVDYPSTEHNIEELANTVIPPAIVKCESHSPVHFVTHSLGGILVRQYLSQHRLEALGRVVMLGPPNQGSEVVDTLADMPGFYLVNGPAGLQLGTDDSSVPNTLGGVDFDVGIIAGTSTINWILSSIIPGPDDGKVSVQRAQLKGMRDFITLPVSHTFLMKNDAVIHQVIFYLRNGKFEHPEKNPSAGDRESPP